MYTFVHFRALVKKLCYKTFFQKVTWLAPLTIMILLYCVQIVGNGKSVSAENETKYTQVMMLK